jgi:hypothetical protein
VTVGEAPPAEALSLTGPAAEVVATPNPSLFSALAIVLLILIPVAVFAGGALIAGHPLLSGDNLIQSYPLRVLVGTDLSHGRLPMWDPWIWSGTPLMAGLNAGAFYPTTLLFAVLNPGAAWIIGQIFVSSSVGVGMYLFLRATGPGAWASFLGALTLTFAGAIATQASVHLDMGEGFASLPWMLLAVRRLLDDGRWRWCVLLAAAFACLVLSGSPEAILDVTILSLAFGLARLSLQPSAWSRLLTRAATGFALGAGVTAAVWLPALHFIAISQRADVGSAFAATYRFPPHELILGLVPFLEGGYGLFSQPAYFGLSNFDEVAYYVGILPLIAAIALLGPKWRAWLPRGERVTWYVIIIVGLVLAMPGPLEHVLAHVPFYGQQRDQGRNIVDVDVAASVLFAWWLDGGRRPKGARTRSETVAVAVVAVAVVAIGIWLIASPSSLWQQLRTFPPPRAALDSIGDAVAVTAALALAAAAIVLGRHRLSPALWRNLATAFVLADLALFTCGTGLVSTQAIPSAADPGALLRLVRANLSPGGRYAVYDPDLYYPSASVAAGEPDVGIVTDVPSVEGYGAIVDKQYANATGSHDRTTLAIGDMSMFRPLDLQVMMAPAEEFLTPITSMPPPGPSTAMRTLAEGAGVDPLLPAGDVPDPEDLLPPIATAPPREAMSDGDRTGWFFGTQLSPTAAELVLSKAADGQQVRVGEITATRSVDWQPPQLLRGPAAPTGGETVTIKVPTAPSVGLIVQLLTGPSLGPLQLAVRADARSYEVNGPLEIELTPLSWTSVGEVDNFALFRTDAAPAQAWAQPIGSGANGPRVAAETRVLAQSDDGATIEVQTSAPAELVRSVAWDPGWHAQIVSGPSATDDLGTRGPAAGALAGATGAADRQLGLVQAVDVPAGVSVVRFWYEPPGFSTGLALMGLSLAATALGWIAVVVAGRRRRRRAAPAPTPTPTP